MLVLLGALKEEIVDVRRRMVLEETFAQDDCRMYRGKYRSKDILLVQTGMGREKAERATALVLERYPVTALVSLGFARALTEQSKAGDIILCTTLFCENKHAHEELESVSSYRSSPDLIYLALRALEGTTARFRQGKSVTVSRPVSDPGDKRALGETFHAEVVEMENYWIAGIASASNVPFMAVRIILDTMQDSLPAFDRILDSNGKWRWHGAVPYFVSRPQHLISLFVLYRKARQARRSLTAFVDRYTESRKQQPTTGGGRQGSGSERESML